MALAGRKSVQRAQHTADRASDIRVSGGRGMAGASGQSLTVMLPLIEQSGTVVLAYQGSWPNPVDAGQEQFVGAFQYVCVATDPENLNVQFDLNDSTITRYWRTGYLGSGAALGITLEAASGKYRAIRVKLMGLAFIWVESDALVKPGERVGSQTAVQGVGDAVYDHLGPSLLVRRIVHDDPLEEGRELWLVRHTCLRGDNVMVEKSSTGEICVAKTILFDYSTYELSNPNPGEIVVDVRP